MNDHSFNRDKGEGECELKSSCSRFRCHGIGDCGTFSKRRHSDIVVRHRTERVDSRRKAKGWTLEHKQVRNRIVNQAVERLMKQKPAPLMSKENLAFIEVGNFEDDFHRLAECDWIIEVVVERLDVKKVCLKKWMK